MGCPYGICSALMATRVPECNHSLTNSSDVVLQKNQLDG